jgi:hypothetical protein
MVPLLALFATIYAAPDNSPTEVACSIVVAGGSTSSLAAAITAAEAAPELTVCFTDITDWPGGQMTAGGVPAIDFGGPNRQPENQPSSFRSAMSSIPGDGATVKGQTGSGCPGACSVSTKCYLPNVLVEEWIMPRLKRATNLRVFLRTAVIATERHPSTGAVLSLTAVQRTPKPGAPEWSQRLSAELFDWYSPQQSTAFNKATIKLTGLVFIEATELGDVLATSGLRFLQGIEAPQENSSNAGLISQCGQVSKALNWVSPYATTNTVGLYIRTALNCVYIH